MKPLSRLCTLSLALCFGLAHADTDPERITQALRRAVVGIEVSSLVTTQAERPEASSTTPAPAQGSVLGSGLLVSADGLVLTMAYLMDKPGEITVSREGFANVRAKLVGRDKRTGFALLRIPGPVDTYITPEATPLPALGERLVALGRKTLADGSYPMVTDGITSAVGEPEPGMVWFIQATTPQWLGMGGGPLVSQKSGKVVGITAQVYSVRNQASMTFAAPIAAFVRIQDQLITKGRVERAFIGVAAVPPSAQVRSEFGLPPDQGVVVALVNPQGSAARAGLQKGDIALQIDGQAIQSVGGLYEAIGAHQPGQTLQLTVQRMNKRLTLPIVCDLLVER